MAVMWSLSRLLCIVIGYLLVDQAIEFHHEWQIRQAECDATRQEYRQHRCRDTQHTTTNRMIMAECHRLDLLLQTTVMERTLAYTTNRWVQRVGRWNECLRYALAVLVYDTAYNVIFLVASLAMCLYNYQYWRDGRVARIGTDARRHQDAIRARVTDDYLFGHE